MDSRLLSPRAVQTVLVVMVAVGALMLCAFLGTVPGLHGDEAWAGLRAEEIIHGDRPMVGMNGYTGPLHQYLLAPLLYWFGFKVAVLRLPTVLASLVCMVLYYRTIKGWFDEQVAVLSVVFLVAMPCFTAYGRIAHEVFALNPILAMSAILLLRASHGENWKARKLYHVLAGICLGLGIWNHLIFLAVPAAMLVVAFWRQGPGLIYTPTFYAAGYGTLLALTPRIFALMSSENPGGVWQIHLDWADFIFGFFKRIWEWPGLLLQIAHGDILFQRFTGRVVLGSPNLVWPFFLIGVGLMLRKAWLGRNQASSTEMETILFGFTLFLTTGLLCPANADRYFLLILYLTPIFSAYAVNECLRFQRLRKPTVLLVSIFIILYISRTWLNYYAPLIESSCRCSTFPLGNKIETSNHFIQTDGLYQDLVRRGAKHIYAEFFIAMPLRFYDLEARQFVKVNVVWSADDLLKARDESGTLPQESYAVVYAAELRRIGPADCGESTVSLRDAQFVVLKLK